MSRLSGKRVLVTQADTYMGPPIVELFREQGAEVVADTSDLRPSAAAADRVAAAGPVDVLVANLAQPPHPSPVGEISDEDWHALFDVMVHPLMRLVRAVAPSMLERGRGKIVAVTSASPLRGIPRAAAYCSARGAQNAFIRAAGVELAAGGVQVNAIAQNYVANDTYYPPHLLQTERFQKHLSRNVPLGRVAAPRETAELALFLASDASDFMVGQVIPFAGGWA